MSEKTYEFPGDYVLDVLDVTNELDVPRDGLAEPQLVLAYNPVTGKFVWVWEIPPHMSEVTPELLESLPAEAFTGLDDAVQDRIDQVSDPRYNTVAGIQLHRLGTRLPTARLAETGIRDLTLRLLEAGLNHAKI
ncbi:hypothetical protein [Myceligenerans crystallogenes]|uniref:Uncharacterized protein n=1 Tax=Myceligenerans crystallogenes TaxID=316335 RepID=A0ABP4ZHW3_9MICO